MALEVTTPQAAKLITSALTDLNRYKDSRRFKVLESARGKLNHALRSDPNYLQALYYHAVVNDLMGNACEAIPELETLLGEEPRIVATIKYNLAVAYYHRYNQPSLREAARHLRQIIRTSTDPCLHLLAQACLAKTYAMSIIPPDPRRFHRASAKRRFALSREACRALQAALQGRRAQHLDKPVLASVNSDLLNARATSSMYYSDFFWSEPEKIRHLRAALRDLTHADRYVPRDWANWCNRASANMRLGYWTKSERHFKVALRNLHLVMADLRPHYGFALYESGRVCRLMGKFEAALECFDKAVKIPYKIRDVSDRRIALERERARAESVEYP